MDRWVINASPLICLAKAGYADLLLKLPGEAVIPQAVVDEIQAGQAGDPARKVIDGGEFSIATVTASAEILAWDLGKGETAVLSYALAHSGCTTIIDDRAARKCALSFSIPFKGTLAVVILAKKRGLISSAAEVMRALQTAGLRLEDDVIRAALQQSAGEDWEP
jgi:predicted nucleic acid-binding protein